MEEDSKLIDYIIYAVAGTGVAALFFLLYLFFSESVPSSTWLAFAIVPIGLVAGIMCVWLATEAEGEKLDSVSRQKKIIAFGGEPALRLIGELEELIDFARKELSRVDTFLADEAQSGNLILSIPGSALQSFELTKKYIKVLEERHDTVLQLLIHPSEKTIQHANRILAQPIDVSVDTTNSIISGDRIPPVPMNQCSGVIRSLVNQVAQHLPEGGDRKIA